MSKHLLLAATTACLTAALFGYSVGFIGGILILPSFLTHFSLSTLSPSLLASAQSRIVSLWLFGAFLGVPISIPVCERWGRRGCLVFAAVLYVCGTLFQIVDFESLGNRDGGRLVVFEVGRFVNGIGVGAGTLVSPIYIAEISTIQLRATLMSGYQTTLQLSALAGFWIAYASNAILPQDSDLQWQIPVAVQLVPGILLLFGMSVGIVPESPVWLAGKERWGEVERSLGWLRGVDGVGEEVAVLKKGSERRESQEMEDYGEEKVSFWKEALRPAMRRRLGVGIGLMVAQNMVGLNALNYYAPVIFMSAGFTSISSSLFLTGIFGIVKLLSAIAFMFVFVKIKGNRFWLKLGSALCAFSMLVLAYFVRILPPPSKLREADLTFGGIVSVLMVYLFAFSFSVSLGPISWNVCSEIFPSHINAKCCAVTTCTQWLFQIVIAALTPHLLASVGWVTYLVYALFCILTFIWVTNLVPETKGVALGKEMDELFGGVDDEDEDEDLEIAEVGERTGLLRRRGSLGAYT